jgi:SAM-dependent methyltransferase
MAAQPGGDGVTPVREFFEGTLLPAFARRFGPADLVLNVGAGDHPYREHITCRLVTADRQPGCDQQFVAEQMPYADASIDGVLMMGVFERLDDPMQVMRELRRVLKPGGWLLMSALDRGFEWHKDVDRWRVTPGGAAHLVSGFRVEASHSINGQAHFLLAQKPPAVSR